MRIVSTVLDWTCIFLLLSGCGQNESDHEESQAATRFGAKSESIVAGDFCFSENESAQTHYFSLDADFNRIRIDVSSEDPEHNYFADLFVEKEQGWRLVRTEVNGGNTSFNIDLPVAIAGRYALVMHRLSAQADWREYVPLSAPGPLPPAPSQMRCDYPYLYSLHASSSPVTPHRLTIDSDKTIEITHSAGLKPCTSWFGRSDHTASTQWLIQSDTLRLLSLSAAGSISLIQNTVTETRFGPLGSPEFFEQTGGLKSWSKHVILPKGQSYLEVRGSNAHLSLSASPITIALDDLNETWISQEDSLRFFRLQHVQGTTHTIVVNHVATDFWAEGIVSHAALGVYNENLERIPFRFYGGDYPYVEAQIDASEPTMTYTVVIDAEYLRHGDSPGAFESNGRLFYRAKSETQ